MQSASKAEQLFRPGEDVPESGVYTVVHEGHRQRHSATIFKGERFPLCARCGKQVRFVLLRRSSLIADDIDFQQGTDTGARPDISRTE
jgi:hypothetical protein